MFLCFLGGLYYTRVYVIFIEGGGGGGGYYTYVCFWRILHLSPVLALRNLSRCKFSTLTTRQPMVEFYLLTFPRFPLRKKEHKSCFDKNRTHDFRTSRCASYLLDHSGDDTIHTFMLLLVDGVTIQMYMLFCFLGRGLYYTYTYVYVIY